MFGRIKITEVKSLISPKPESYCYIKYQQRQHFEKVTSRTKTSSEQQTGPVTNHRGNKVVKNCSKNQRRARKVRDEC